VRDVWRYRFLTTSQIRELWWPGRSVQAARRRLVKLFRAGYLERFRPHSPRGSYEWTYFLSAAGHQLLRELGVVDAGARFKPREVFDHGRVVHDLQLNAWVLAYRRVLGPRLLKWQGEQHIAPPRSARQSQLQLEDYWSVERLRDPSARPVIPDAALEIAEPGRAETLRFLLEFDRTNRSDKNYDKFRRYDAFLTWWWRHTPFLDHADPPWVLFVCQDEHQRDKFLAAADRDLTGHLWHPSLRQSETHYIGRRRILFACEADAHTGVLEARRVPGYPPGHPARHGRLAQVRRVRLPGCANGTTPSSPPGAGQAAGTRDPLPPRAQ
jgi:Replication-relaxation